MLRITIDKSLGFSIKTLYINHINLSLVFNFIIINLGNNIGGHGIKKIENCCYILQILNN
jgi:hypothetical protein